MTKGHNKNNNVHVKVIWLHVLRLRPGKGY